MLHGNRVGGKREGEVMEEEEERKMVGKEETMETGVKNKRMVNKDDEEERFR